MEFTYKIDTWGLSIYKWAYQPWQLHYTVWVKKIPNTVFWYFFPDGWEFLIDYLHTYYTFLSTLDYKFFIQLFPTLTKPH